MLSSISFQFPHNQKIVHNDVKQWCNTHMPNRWCNQYIKSPPYSGFGDYNKTAYKFNLVEDALLFKLQYPKASIPPN